MFKSLYINHGIFSKSHVLKCTDQEHLNSEVIRLRSRYCIFRKKLWLVDHEQLELIPLSLIWMHACTHVTYKYYIPSVAFCTQYYACDHICGL